MFLLEKEKIILESYPLKAFSFFVTNYRIRWETKDGPKLQMTSIMLEALTSIELAFRHNLTSIMYGMVMLILLAGAGTAVGEHFGDTQIINIGWYGGLVCLLLGVIMYFPTRKYEIYFSSSSTSIIINVKGLGEQDIREMIETVEKAKLERERNLREKERAPVVRKIVKKQVTPAKPQEEVKPVPMPPISSPDRDLSIQLPSEDLPKEQPQESPLPPSESQETDPN